MGFYRLLPTAHIVYDQKGASVIDTLTFQKINYSYDDSILLKELLENESDDLGNLEKEKRLLLEHLMSEGYCYYYDKPAFNDIHKDKNAVEIRGLMEEIPHFSEIFFEIGANGNKEESDIKEYICGCHACKEWPHKNRINNKTIDFDSIISRIVKLWVDKLVLTGSNPLAHSKMIANYVDKIRKYREDLCIEIISPIIPIEREMLEYLSSQNVNLGIVVKDSDLIEGNLVEKFCLQIKQAGINQDIYYNGENLNNDLFDKLISLGIAVNVNRNMLNDKKTYKNRIEEGNKDYWTNQSFHHCLKNKMAITKEGFVRPCPMINDDLWDLGKQTVDQLFQEQKLDDYWRLTKREIQGCSDCRNRYFCTDCALAELMVKDGILKHEVLCRNDDANNTILSDGRVEC